MLSTGAAPPAVQLLITLLLCLVPTLALFGLLRLLAWLRDDDLVERVAAETEEPLEPTAIDEFLANGTGEGSSGRSSGEPGSGRSQSADEPGVRCRHCGTPNPGDVRYCEECIGKL